VIGVGLHVDTTMYFRHITMQSDRKDATHCYRCSVASVSVSVCWTQLPVGLQKRVKRSRCRFGIWTMVSPRSHILDRGPVPKGRDNFMRENLPAPVNYRELRRVVDFQHYSVGGSSSAAFAVSTAATCSSLLPGVG